MWTLVASSTDTYKVNKEAVQESLREILFHDNTQNVDLTQVGCEVVIWNNPEYVG